MLERINPYLKLVSLVFAGLVLFQLSRLAARRNSLAHIDIADAAIQVLAKPDSPTNSVPATLPPEISARIEKIKESQILGMVMRPPPMALIGIAGKDVLLRTANGQTGLIREGEELGGIKLIRIGTNRVLIEQEGKQKELTLFEGFGSDTLLGKEQPK